MSHWLRPASPELGTEQPGLFELLRERLGDRYLPVLLFGAGASIPALTLVAVAMLIGYTEDASPKNYTAAIVVAVDDGAGFDPASAGGSAGMQNMADRIGALGGELRVESAAGQGTLVEGRIAVA